MYKITVGHEGATDSCLCLNDKQYGVESEAWNILSVIKWQVESGEDECKNYEFYHKILDLVYKNFDDDIFVCSST